jgi:hypothetical protein
MLGAAVKKDHLGMAATTVQSMKRSTPEQASQAPQDAMACGQNGIGSTGRCIAIIGLRVVK